jgi:hypothetical protein
MTMLETALFYAERGWHVFPCLAGLKTPATQHGWHDATTDPDRIRAWWQANPNYNIAIATGPSGLFVVDIDPGAEEAWEELVSSDTNLALALSLTYAVQTPRGGWHYYFAGEGKSSASKLLKNVDTRGIGGYVLAPPSRVSDSKAQGSYILDTDQDVRPIPASLAQRMAVQDALPTAPNLPADQVPWDAPETINRALAWIEGLVGSGGVAIEGCGGDDRTYRTCCRLLEMGIKPDTAYQLLLEHWNPFCIPPWEPKDLEAKILSAWEYGQQTKGGKAELPLEEQHSHLIDQANALNLDGIPEEYRHLLPVPLMDARRNLKPLEWLLDGFLPKQGVGFLYGPSGTYKTFIALDLALSIATGHGPNWWEDGDKDPQPVVYLVGESAHAFKSQRIDSWLHRHQIPGLGSRMNNLLVYDDVMPLERADQWGWFIELVKRQVAARGHKRPAMLVIDTLSKAMVGWSIGDPKDAAIAERRFRLMAKELNCLVLLVHHVGKDDNRGMVGSYIYYANADTVIEAQRESETSKVVLIETRKQKEADSGPPKRFVGSIYGDSVAFERDWTAKFDMSSGTAKVLTGPGSEEYLQPEALVEVLREGPMSTDHLADSLSVRWQVSSSLIKRRLKKMAAKRYRAWMLSEDIWSIPTMNPTPDIDTSIF